MNEKRTSVALGEESVEEPRDRTKWIWLGVVLLAVALSAVLWLAGRPDPKISLVRAKHILIEFSKSDPADRTRALEFITELRERVLRGERFETLAREYSTDVGSSRRGGDLGYFPRDSFAKEFEEYVWSAPVGQLSDVIETSFGFHLIVVEDRHLADWDRYDKELDDRAREEMKGNAAEPPKAP